MSSNGTTYMGVRNHIAYRFLGIPYILQPVGDLRLAYPIQWYTNETSYVFNATTCKFLLIAEAFCLFTQIKMAQLVQQMVAFTMETRMD